MYQGSQAPATERLHVLPLTVTGVRPVGSPSDLHNNVPRHEEQERAEERLRKVAEVYREGERATDEYAAQARAVEDKTARLRSLRLAKEAADKSAEPKPPPTKGKPPVHPRSARLRRIPADRR